MSARIAITNTSKGVLFAHDSGEKEYIPKNAAKLLYKPTEDAIYLVSFNQQDKLISHKNNVKSITDSVAGTTPTVGASVSAIFDQIKDFFF